MDLGPRTKEPPTNALSSEKRDLPEPKLGEGGETRLRTALADLARRRLVEAQARGVEVISTDGFLRHKREAIEAEHGATLRALAAQNPGWTATRLANFIDPQPQRLPEYKATGTGLGAVAKNEPSGNATQ